VPAPVALFTYNRLEHTKATLEALARNILASQTEVHIFSDGPKTAADRSGVESVRELLQSVAGFATVRVVVRQDNLGLANSIIQGMSQLLDVYKYVIVLEDDLITSRHFLSYMNAALEKYRDDPHVFSVTGHTFPSEYLRIPPGYPYDTYAGYRCSSWSWGTWPDRWRRIDWDMKYFSKFDSDPLAQEKFNFGGADMTALLRLQHAGQIDSWAIRFCYAHHAHDMRCIYPTKTLVRNIGLDNSGTHSKPEPRYSHRSLDETWLPRHFCPADSLDPTITANFRSVFDPPQSSVGRRHFRKARNETSRFYHKARRLVVRIKNRINPPVRDVDILVVNTSQKSGGAARAAFRIFCGIRHRYPAAHYLTLTKEDFDQGITGHLQISLKGILAQRFVDLDQIPLRFYPTRQRVTFSPAFWANPLRTPLNRFRAKLVHLHWVGAGMLRVEELSRLRCPIVWTLHDTWAFTGGCHYMRDCEGYKKQCGYCPQLNSQRKDDYSHSLMRRKDKAFRKLDITVVTPSRWLAETAKQSSLFGGKRIEVIPNGLDTDVFRPVDHQVAREYLNLRRDEAVILFGAQWLTDPRKGGDLLQDALRQLHQPCTLLLFGQGMLSLENFSHIHVRRLGNLADDISLAMVYSAADVFVCPSREDNLPNTIAEALACGTPCAAFAINGVPDMIDHQKNGWLARPFDTADLAEGIRWLTKHPQHNELRKAAREKAVSEYSLSVMSQRYKALYEDVLKDVKDRDDGT
jgi:glycosyltransferase involved in cell wall biosynthesis